MAIDTAAKRASTVQSGLTPGIVLPIPDGEIDASDRAHLAGAYGGLFADVPDDFAIAGYNGGVAVDATGVMGTVFLADATPVPASAMFPQGFAHTQAGLRYVAAWPGSGLVDYQDGVARRRDGAMCIVSSGTPRDFMNGWGLSDRGEVIAAVSAPQLIFGGYGLLQNGTLCVSEAA